MPRAKGSGDKLPPILLKYLATGDRSDPGAPPGGRGPEWGCWEAFALHGRWLKWSMAPGLWPHLDGVPAELLELWQRHHEEIEAAAPPGFAPYIWSMLLEVERLQRGGEPRRYAPSPKNDETDDETDEQHDAP